jgi:hypothetical protein
MREDIQGATKGTKDAKEDELPVDLPKIILRFLCLLRLSA